MDGWHDAFIGFGFSMLDARRSLVKWSDFFFMRMTWLATKVDFYAEVC